MRDQIRIMGPRRGDHDSVRPNEIYINTTSKDEWCGLSPFRIGPCKLPYYGTPKPEIQYATLMENAWQFAKVYSEHADENGNPTKAYWRWARAGWNSSRPQRYPMGKGRKPLYSLWNGERLDYIAARKKIYIPLYRSAVSHTTDFGTLIELYDKGYKLALWDFDGYDHEKLGMSLYEVLNDPTRKMGHAFVLKMMLMYGSYFEIKDLKRGKVK